jgi:hypothetical protein
MISGPRSALLEPEPNSKIRRLFPGNNPSSLGGPVSAIVADHINGIAVLEYGSTEILPPVCLLFAVPAGLCRPCGEPSRAHPRGKPGFSTYEGGFGRETDSPLEGDGFEPSVPGSTEWPCWPATTGQLRYPRCSGCQMPTTSPACSTGRRISRLQRDLIRRRGTVIIFLGWTRGVDRIIFGRIEPTWRRWWFLRPMTARRATKGSIFHADSHTKAFLSCSAAIWMGSNTS